MLTVYNVDDGADLRRGRVNSLLLPQEDLVERFVSLLHDKPKSWRTTKKGWFGKLKSVSVCTWQGAACDSTRTITGLTWPRSDVFLNGQLCWQYLPRSLLRVNIAHHGRLQGDLTDIQYPPGLYSLIAGYNSFSGTMDLTNLPDPLIELKLDSNLLSGNLNLSSLPPVLHVLLLDRNRFSGTISLDKLPMSLYSLQLSHNLLKGVAEFQCHITPKSRPLHIDLRFNQFTSYTPTVKLPSNLKYCPQMSDRRRTYSCSDSSSSSDCTTDSYADFEI